jgi:alkanesulfonate monooxygenase SsuD/methylene tetrahydromethanopterin reductase-like flavin-dependent oxidoreductase (luciferase family)
MYQRHFGGRSDGREQRTGFLRGTPKDVMDMVGAFRDAGCTRLNIAFREGPYDWDALHAFAEHVLPAFGVRKEAARR